MESYDIFGKTIASLQRALDVRTRKHDLTISNIANADTPNFKAFEMVVEEELTKAASLQQPKELRVTDRLHLPSAITNCSFHHPNTKRAQISKEVTLRGDGNTVHMEKEMAAMAENSLMYRTSTQLLTKKFEGLINAIRGGRK
jgi:flagellar basal-body rod protein FlgB